MKKNLLFTLILIISSSGIFAKNLNDKLYQDVLLLTNGEVIKGEIVKFGTNSFKVVSIEGKVTKIENSDVSMIAVAQDMTPDEKYRLGVLDGKRYAVNKGGNFAIGFFGAFLGTAIVYATSDQFPSDKALQGSNKTIINDTNYLLGYSKGAKTKSGKSALHGTYAVLALVVLSFKGTFY